MSKPFCFSILLIVFISNGCKKPDACNANAPIVVADKYIYPVQPNSPEWNAAGTWGIGRGDPLDSIYRLCQIPETKLATISTLGLIQSLEENPCLFNMFLRTDKFQGRNEVLRRLNVSWTLNKRFNAASELVSYYKTKDPNYALCLKTTLDQGKFSNNWHLFDMVCTQDSILSQMDKTLSIAFAKTIIEKYKIQVTLPEIYGSSKTTAVLILSLIMAKQSYKPFTDELQTNNALSIFITTGVQTTDLFNTILDLANKFINS